MGREGGRGGAEKGAPARNLRFHRLGLIKERVARPAKARSRGADVSLQLRGDSPAPVPRAPECARRGPGGPGPGPRPASRRAPASPPRGRGRLCRACASILSRGLPDKRGGVCASPLAPRGGTPGGSWSAAAPLPPARVPAPGDAPRRRPPAQAGPSQGRPPRRGGCRWIRLFSGATGPRRKEINGGKALSALTEPSFGASVSFLPFQIQFKIANSF